MLRRIGRSARVRPSPTLSGCNLPTNRIGIRRCVAPRTGGMVGKKECPVLRPSRKEFSIPFADYVSTYFRNNPDVPIIKVIPPEGYKPRSTEYPAGLRIEVPIEQNVRRGIDVLLYIRLHVYQPLASLQVLNHTNRAGFYDCVLLAKPVRCTVHRDDLTCCRTCRITVLTAVQRCRALQ